MIYDLILSRTPRALKGVKGKQGLFDRKIEDRKMDVPQSLPPEPHAQVAMVRSGKAANKMIEDGGWREMV